MQQVDNQQATQEGFVLALALLLMLFMGVIVISSAQKTGTETRVAQSEAPIATLQAAAEQGFFELKNRIQYAVDGDNQITADYSEKTFSEICNHLKDADNADLDDLFSDIDYPKLYRSTSHSRDVYWWFEADHFDIEDVTTDPCILEASVFVGDPDESPGIFMSAEIDIKEVPPSSSTEDKVNDLLGLGDDKAFADLDADDLSKFYGQDFWDTLDTSTFSGKVMPAGSVLNESDLEAGKINVIILEGGVRIPTSTTSSDNNVIIISNKSDEVCFFNNAGDSCPSSGGGNQKEDLNGWIVAPNAEVNAGRGRHLGLNVVADVCRTGNKTNKCFHSSGGSSFRGDFGADDFDDPDNGGGGGGGGGGATVENLEMQFDY